MGYYLYDATGYIADGPSTRGLADLVAWASDKPAIAAFLRAGMTADPDALVGALLAAPAPPQPAVASSYRALLAAAREADEVLILTDGVAESGAARAGV